MEGFVRKEKGLRWKKRPRERIPGRRKDGDDDAREEAGDKHAVALPVVLVLDWQWDIHWRPWDCCFRFSCSWGTILLREYGFLEKQRRLRRPFLQLFWSCSSSGGSTANRTLLKVDSTMVLLSFMGHTGDRLSGRQGQQSVVVLVVLVVLAVLASTVWNFRNATFHIVRIGVSPGVVTALLS